MATIGGYNIVTDGLVLSLDAANPKSYPRSGTTWRDLSGNGNNGSLVNGPTFNSGNGGSIVFDSANDYVNFNLINLSNIFTINIVAKAATGSGTNVLLCPSSNNVDNWIAIANSKTQMYFTEFADFNNVAFNGNTTIDTSNNVWYSFTATCNVNTASLYVNGNFDGSTTVGFNIGAWSGSNSSIGRRAGGGASYFSGSIALVQAYNRVLSAQEILQNYNAQKGRFGL